MTSHRSAWCFLYQELCGSISIDGAGQSTDIYKDLNCFRGENKSECTDLFVQCNACLHSLKQSSIWTYWNSAVQYSQYEKKTIVMESSPVQVTPSPLYPSSHVQVYPPGMLAHSALTSQGPEAHSLISEEKIEILRFSQPVLFAPDSLEIDSRTTTMFYSDI